MAIALKERNEQITALYLLPATKGTLMNTLGPFTHGDPQIRADLGQDTMEKAIRYWEKRDPKRNQHAWIATIARNNAIDIERRKKCMTQQPLPDTNDEDVHWDIPTSRLEDPAVIVESRVMGEKIRNAFTSITNPIMQQVAGLFFYRNLRYHEIAAELNIAEGTVKSYIFRSREILQRELADFH